MLTRERKGLILETLRRDGRIVAKSFAHGLNLSEDTIRRDLRELASDGRLQRVHGGALPASPAVVDFDGRRTLASSAKAAIGRAAAALVRPGQVVFLDGGTTAVQLARHLAPDLKATVVTHSPSIGVELSSHAGITVRLIGGLLFKHSIVAVGAEAAAAIARVRADVYFMGVTGLHPETGLTTGDAEEAAIKGQIARQSAETVVLASSEKLGAASPYVVAPLTSVGTIVVEKGLSAEVLQPYRALDIVVIEG